MIEPDRNEASHRSASAAAGYVWWAAVIALSTILLVPLLVVDVPPLLDYPNHLARAFILASLPDDTIVDRFYTSHWSITPNLALDLVAPLLIHFLPVHVAGRLLIAVAVLLPVLGSIAYNLALGGRWWSFGVGLVAYNISLLAGFLNFSISLGLALLLGTAWLRWREDYPRRTITLALAGAPILFACHLMGLVFYGLLIGGTELFRLYQTRQVDLWGGFLTRGLVLLLIFVPPLTLYTVADLQRLGGDAAYLPLDDKLLQLMTTFANYAWPLDLTTALLAVAIPALSLARRRGRVPGSAACAIGLLLIAFLGAPYAWKGTYALDTRFAIMLGFMLFAGFVPDHWPAALRRCTAVALLLLFLARMALLTTAWRQHATDLADLRTALGPVRPGQAVYVAEVAYDEAPSYWEADPAWRRLSNGLRTDDHLGALALIEHRAYWPFEFDVPSQQPIKTREPYRTLADRVGHIPSWTEAGIANVCGFDYVLLQEADAVPELPAKRFRLLVQSGFAALYAITKCQEEP